MPTNISTPYRQLNGELVKSDEDNTVLTMILRPWKILMNRVISILGEVRNVEISSVLCSRYHDFLAIFALAHLKIA